MAQLGCDSPYSTIHGSDEETLRKLQSCFSYFDQQQLRRDLDFGEAEDDDDESEGITISFSAQHSKDSEPRAPSSLKQNLEDKTHIHIEQPDMVLLPNRGMSKVPTIASDKELAKLESIRKATTNKQQQQSSSSSTAAAFSVALSSSGSKIDAPGKGRLDPKKARALRRKLYLDLYREAAGKLGSL